MARCQNVKEYLSMTYAQTSMFSLSISNNMLNLEQSKSYMLNLEQPKSTYVFNLEECSLATFTH